MRAARTLGLVAVLGASVWLNGAARAAVPTNVITTVIGNGSAVSSGDGGPAYAATVYSPVQLAWLPDGSLIWSESIGYRVRRLDPSGTVTRIAGNGSGASSGDGGLATSGSINRPNGLAVAPDSNVVYVSDNYGNRVRRFTVGGNITTIVGDGSAASTGDGGAASSATVSSPGGLSVAENGDLYIADGGGGRVRKIEAGPDQIADGTDTITTVAGGGGSTAEGVPATSALLSSPNSVLVASDGSFITNSGHKLRRVDAAGDIQTWAGQDTACPSATNLCGDNGPALYARFNSPRGLAWDATQSAVYLVDSGTVRLRRVDAGGRVSTVAGNGTSCTLTALCGDGGPAALASIPSASFALTDPSTDEVYVSTGHRIRKITWNPFNTGPAGPDGPAGDPGADGATGATGSVGASGAPGATGATGPNGPAGLDGPDGPVGPPGAAGAAGPDGRRGRDGVAGARGAAGADGRNAPTGTSLPLVATLPATRLSKRARRTMSFRVFVSGPATVELRATRERRSWVAKRTVSRSGRVTLTLKRLPRGSYKLRLVARRGNAVNIDRGSLRVR